MKEELVSTEKAETGLNISLMKNNFRDDGSLIARARSQVLNVRNVLLSIQQADKGLDVSGILRSLELYQQKVLELLGMGFAIKLLDLGLVYMAPAGTVRNREEAEAMTRFVVRFSPSRKLQEVAGSLNVHIVTTVDNSPVITEVYDLAAGREDGKVTRGQPVSLRGNGLKTGAEGDGVWFVPQTAEEVDVADKGAWLRVPQEKVFRNLPREVNLFAPEGLEPGVMYRIRISTSWLSSKQVRKTPLSGESAVITAR